MVLTRAPHPPRGRGGEGEQKVHNMQSVHGKYRAGTPLGIHTCLARSCALPEAVPALVGSSGCIWATDAGIQLANAWHGDIQACSTRVTDRSNG